MRALSILLIVIGAICLLGNFGLNILGLSGLVNFIFKFWPIVLIYLGYRMLKQDRGSERNEATGSNQNEKTAQTENYTYDEHIEPVGSEKYLGISMTDTIGEISLFKCEKNLFAYKAGYHNKNIYNYQYTPGENGQLLITNSFTSEKLFTQLKDRGMLDLGVTDQVPIDLHIKTGIGSTNLDLSGLKVEKLKVSTGASSLRVRFGAPNDVFLKQFDLMGGASSLKAFGLADANFKVFNFDGGAGKYLFDFSGTLRESAIANIKCGGSLVDFLIPSNIPTKIQLVSTLASFKVTNDFVRKSESSYQNTAYETRGDKKTLEINIEAGLSSVTVN